MPLSVGRLAMCLGPIPGSWSSAETDSGTSLPSGTDFGLTAEGVSGDNVLGQYVSDSELGVGLIDFKSKEFTKLAPRCFKWVAQS